MIEKYNKDEMIFSLDFIEKHTTKSYKDKIGKVHYTQLKNRRGFYLSKIYLYSKHYSLIFNVTTQAITGILNLVLIHD